ncbi:MAG: hypothetical protein KKD39_02605 [Candidatus Altiarchaeota archaeon]|nr:hypothetical protein [Candidatus Altiarchaeota archaeon]
MSGCFGSPLPKDIRGEGNGSKYMDPQACEEKDGKMKDLCYVNTAPQLKDETLCEKIHDERYMEICYGRVGVATGNNDLCDKITDTPTRQQCHTTLQENKKLF